MPERTAFSGQTETSWVTMPKRAVDSCVAHALIGEPVSTSPLDDAGRPVMGWCFVPSGHLVAGDVMLAQKIASETNERAALAVAN
jgi:hypothetical protein